MLPAPPKIVEEIVSLLVPSACREEVLGDLSEISTSPVQYIREVTRVVPLVILSRIRRTADPAIVLMEATSLYLSFVGAARLHGKFYLGEDSNLLKLAIPPACVLFGLLLYEAYTSPGIRSVLRPIRGPLLGFGFAYLSQWALSASTPVVALPPWIMFYGSGIGMLFSMMIKSLFPPVTDRPLGAAGPALWLKHVPEPLGIAPEVISIVKALAFVLVLAFVGAQLGGRLLSATLVLTGVCFLIARELKERR